MTLSMLLGMWVWLDMRLNLGIVNTIMVVYLVIGFALVLTMVLPFASCGAAQ